VVVRWVGGGVGRRSDARCVYEGAAILVYLEAPPQAPLRALLPRYS
jgi:hypothetical protein